MPPTRDRRIIYGAIVGALFAPAAHIGSFYFSPELALVVGNMFSYFASPKGRYKLTLIGHRELARNTYEFIFKSDRRIPFTPGQYLEWTVGDVPFDIRGNRRYFTISSAPEESTVACAMRFLDESSAFKKSLASLQIGEKISAASLSGDFILPKNTKKKLAFIAGGIGITPFVSMARHGIVSGESRDAVLLYSNRTAEDVAYKDVFVNAGNFGWRTVYTFAIIDAEAIKREIPDYKERFFYVSGPPIMVSAMKKALLSIGVSRSSIKTDYFPGLA